MQIKTIMLILLFALYSCNTNTDSISNHDEILKNDSQVSIDTPKETKLKTPDTVIPEPTPIYEPPIIEISREVKTDENFQDYYEIEIKNNSKKTITNILTENLLLIPNKDARFQSKGDLVNHRINISPEKTKILKVSIDEIYRRPKIVSVRYSDGDTYKLDPYDMFN